LNDLGWYIYITFSFSFNVIVRKEKGRDGSERSGDMRGYFTASGYYGLVDGHYRFFASESEYYEAVEED
jgi:hypothetical protein